MRRLVGALVALALLTACSGKAAPSGLEGVLRQVGGRHRVSIGRQPER